MSQVISDRPPATDTADSRNSSGQPKSCRNRPATRLVHWAVHNLPTVLVIAVLGAIGAYGHANHWKLPTFAALTGAVPPAADDWCEEHGVPESACVACNPDLMPSEPDYGWCAEHGVHNCTLHHPDVAQLKEPPNVSEAEFSRAAHVLALRDRPRNNAACKVYQQRIQFASVDAVQQAGVDVELVDRQPVSESVTGNGEIRYDATRFASLSSRVPGTVWQVLKNIGDRVQNGEVLAIVDAMEVGRAKSELVKALAAEDLANQTLDRLKGLPEGIVPGRQVLEAEAELAKAEAEVLSAEQALANLDFPVDVDTLRDIPQREIVERLRFLGLPAQLVQQVKSQTSTANLIPIRSPLSGVVVERLAVAGEVVNPTRNLFEVADPSRMWLMLNIPLEQADLLSVGQIATFLPNGSRREVSGILSWISTAADKQTRMVQVRADLDNSDGRLRDETFGAGRIVLREEPDAVVVPEKAVHWEGCCHVVFVRDKDYFDDDAPKLFHLRSVRTGVTTEGMTEIIAGVLPGEVVVTEGSDVLRAQLLKNSLGAGCCAE